MLGVIPSGKNRRDDSADSPASLLLTLTLTWAEEMQREIHGYTQPMLGATRGCRLLKHVALLGPELRGRE